MKRIVFILLMANLLFYGWNRGWFESPPVSDTGDPASLQDPEFLQPVPLMLLQADPALPETPSGAGDGEAGASSADSGSRLMPPGREASTPMHSEPLQAGRADAEGPLTEMVATAAGDSDAQPEDEEKEAERKEAEDRAGEQGSEPVDTDSGGPAGTGLPVAPALISQESGFAICWSFAATEPASAGELRAALEDSGAQVQEHRVETGSSYLVHLPAAADEQQARQNLESVRAIGREDAFIIREEPFRLGISLALFRHESAAQSMIDRLERAGEHRAVISARPPFQSLIALRARWTHEDAAASSAPQTVRTLGERFGVAVRECE